MRSEEEIRKLCILVHNDGDWEESNLSYGYMMALKWVLSNED